MDKLKQRIATSALHDTSTRQDDDTSECHPKTRQDLLAQLIDKPAFIKSLIHWFYGPAGAGKTSIMRSLAKALERRNRHLASFYFWRSDGTRNSLRAFVATIAYQIGQQIKPIVPYIEQVLADDGLLLDRSNLTQLEKLVIEPLLALQASNPTVDYPRYLVVDGLDECDEEGQLEFLQTLLPALLTRLSALRLTVYVSSRPETLIEREFNAPLLRDISNRMFLEPSPEDVRTFLIAEFEKVNQRYRKLKEKYGGGWPGDGDLDALCDKSSGYFILSKTAMRHINPPILRGRPPDQRLRDVLEALMAEPYRPLDALYLHILRQHAPQSPADHAEWKKMIGLVCIPLHGRFDQWKEYFGGDNMFLEVYGESRSDLEEALGPLQSLIYIEPSSGKPEYYHASFPDFIFNFERSGDFYVDPGLLHEHLVCALIRSLDIYTPDGFALIRMRTFFCTGLCHHSGPARFTDEVDKAAGEISWDAVCLVTKDVKGFISGLALIAFTIEALENLFSLPDFPRRDEHLWKLASKVASLLSGRMDSITSNDIDATIAHGYITEVGGVLLPLLSETWISDHGPGTPDPFLQHSCVQCLRHGVSSGGHAPSTCSSANCNDRTPFFTPDQDPFKFALKAGCGVFFRLLPPLKITGLLAALLDSPCFPLVCEQFLAKMLMVSEVQPLADWGLESRRLLQYLPHCAPGEDLLSMIWELCNYPKFGSFPIGSTFLVQWKPFIALPLSQMNGPEVCGYYILHYFSKCKAAGMEPNHLRDLKARVLWEEASSQVPATPVVPASSLQIEPIHQHNEISAISFGTASTGIPSDSEEKAAKEEGKKKKPGLPQRFHVPHISSKSGSSNSTQAQKR